MPSNAGITPKAASDSEGRLDFLGGGGEMGALVRALDWAATPLGPPEIWPQSLRTTVRLMLNTRHPMFIWWGPELIQFYNDAYRQTMGPGASSERARAARPARLIALSKAHDVLTEEAWAGADLVDIVRSAVDTFAASDVARFQVTGPSVRLSPRSALLFAMTLNELCTNALKYGALSRPGGQIEISWRLEAPNPEHAELQMRWSESGGPPVKSPTRKGFGSRLIETALAAEFGGGVAVDYAANGLICNIRAPLAAIQQDNSRTA